MRVAGLLTRGTCSGLVDAQPAASAFGSLRVANLADAMVPIPFSSSLTPNPRSPTKYGEKLAKIW